jgi:hypothetical protein
MSARGPCHRRKTRRDIRPDRDRPAAGVARHEPSRRPLRRVRPDFEQRGSAAGAALPTERGPNRVRFGGCPVGLAELGVWRSCDRRERFRRNQSEHPLPKTKSDINCELKNSAASPLRSRRRRGQSPLGLKSVGCARFPAWGRSEPTPLSPAPAPPGPPRGRPRAPPRAPRPGPLRGTAGTSEPPRGTPPGRRPGPSTRFPIVRGSPTRGRK